MNRVIVIGSDHHNTLGVVRGLGERGVNPDVMILSNGGGSFVGKSKYVNRVLFVEDVKEISNSLITNYRSEENKPVVICCADPIESEIDQHYNELRNYFILPGSEIQGRITELMNKQVMSNLASKVGLKIPRTWYIDSECKGLSEVLFPCIVKPLVSKDGCKEDIQIIKTEEKLRDYLVSGRHEKSQIQEFIEKDFEYQLIGCSTNNEVIIPGVSIILRPCKGSNTSFLQYKQLPAGFCDIEKCNVFVKETGYRGLFSMEFIRDKQGRDYFMEINFRNDGNAICTTAAGISLPYVWYLSCLAKDYTEEVQKVLKSVYVMPDMAELKLLLTGKINIVQYIKDLNKTGRFMEYDKEDTKPFWYMLWKEIWSLFK